VKAIFAIFLALHGLIHLLGTASAFGLVTLPHLGQPISPAMGALWLVAALLFLAATFLLYRWPRWWWAVGLMAVVLSQIVIVHAWGDAWNGTIANGVAVVGVAFGFLATGPWSYRAEYEQRVQHDLARLATGSAPALLGEPDLAPLPAAVRRYVRLSGALGEPRVRSFRARFHGEIRSGPETRWMPFTGEQTNCYDEPSRCFIMTASLAGIPFQALHVYAGARASMRVKVAALVRVAEASGPEMDRSETVTLFNDMCVFAPGTLVDDRIGWEEIDARHVRATFTNAGHTIRAVLSFNDAGELVDFVSDDRSQASADGRTLTRARWSTPLGAYRAFGPYRLSTGGEARWHTPELEFAYIRFAVDRLEFNTAAAS
jgi:hypothetical protein